MSDMSYETSMTSWGEGGPSGEWGTPVVVSQGDGRIRSLRQTSRLDELGRFSSGLGGFGGSARDYSRYRRYIAVTDV